MEPTKEQIRKFWEKVLGLEYRHFERLFGGRAPQSGWYFKEQFMRETLPPIDLNNLSKYAMPKIVDRGLWFEIQVHKDHTDVYITNDNDDDPIYFTVEDDFTSALFWALYKALEVEV